MSTSAVKTQTRTDWNTLLSDVVAGRWRDPETGKAVKVPFETIRIAESLEGGAADLVAPLKLGRNLAIISDSNTVEAMGHRVAKELRAWTAVDEIVFPPDTVCDEPTIALMQEKTRHCEACVVVGSGSLSDTVKYAMYRDGRPYASFATAASMNGYGACTASVTLNNGYKTSLAARAPRGVFIDLGVSAAAPTWLSAAGLGDSLCRPVAQVEWWASHRLFGTPFTNTPFALYNEEHDEALMCETAGDLSRHSLAANGYLHRVLMLAGFGNNIIGSSHSGSMGEHQVSHWLDMFAGDAHPGTTHGQQVGVASIAMARLHRQLFALERAPHVKPTRLDRTDFIRRYGADIGAMMFAEASKKALGVAEAKAFNEKLSEVWPELRAQCLGMMMEPETIAKLIAAAGGPTTATELGLPRDIWSKAMKHARDVRNRWSFLDLADDAGLLDEFLSNDQQ